MSITFQNDNDFIKINDGEIRLKGNSGRECIIKNFKMRFRKEDSLYGVKKLSLKSCGKIITNF